MGKVADLFAQITLNSAGLKMGLADAKDQLNNFKSTASMVGGAVSGALKTLLPISSFAGLTLAVTKSIKQTVEYTDQIRELTRATGMSTEQSSRMLQIADDSQVSFSDLTTTMKFAIKSGINPNIEGISTLSDKYLALNSPLERSQMLIKQFGRNGLEMSKIMELGSEKINQIAISTNKYGLVMDSMDVSTIREYERSINDLQTAMKGLGVQFTLSVAPSLIKGANWIAKQTSALTQGNKIWEDATKLYRDGVMASEDYSAIIGNLLIPGFMDVDAALVSYNSALAKNNMYLDENGNVMGRWGSRVLVGADAVNSLKSAIEGTQNLIIPGSIFESITPSLPKDTINSINTIRDIVKINQTGGGVLNTIQKQLGDVANIDPDMAALFGKELLPALYAYEVELGNIKESDALKSLAEDWDVSNSVASKALKTVEQTGGAIANIKGKSVVIDVWIVYHTSGNPMAGTKDARFFERDPGFQESPGGATGLSFVVPPGYPGDSYPIRAQSGERVDITPASETQVSNDALLAEMQAVRKSIEGLPIYIRDAMLVA